MHNRSYLFACLWYSSQSWYRDAPLYPASVCQISRQSDNAFAFYSSFCKCAKRGRGSKKTKKLSQFLKSHISGMPEAISLKFGMWSTEVGGHVYSKNRLVSSRQHRATEVRKLRFLSSCQYTHAVARRLLGPHDTLPCVLITELQRNNHFKMMNNINTLWSLYLNH